MYYSWSVLLTSTFSLYMALGTLQRLAWRPGGRGGMLGNYLLQIETLLCRRERDTEIENLSKSSLSGVT